jgi:hypothetical protein
MAGPFLATLSRSARLFYSAARGGTAQGRSFTATVKAYRDAGNRIGNDIARNIFRAVQAHENQARSVQELPRNRRIPIASLPQALTKIRRNLSFTVEVRGFLPGTGEAFTRHITISANETLTPRRIEQLAEETIASGGDRYGMEVQEVNLIRGERAGRAGTF